MPILFFDESMTITFISKDQRSGKQCPPLNPTIAQIPRIDIRPRGASILDVVQDGDTVTITANGNGTGTVTVVGYVEKQATFPSLDIISILSHPDGVDTGLWERNEIGSKSVINTLGIAISEEVTVLSPEITIEAETEIDDPEIDCPEGQIGEGGPTGDGGTGQGGGDDPNFIPPAPPPTVHNEEGESGIIVDGLAPINVIYSEIALSGTLIGGIASTS